MRRVVITGVGAISAIGLNAKENWENCANGVNGVAPITLFDPSNLSTQIAAEAKGYDPTLTMSRGDSRRRSRYEQFASTATKEALADSGYEITDSNAHRVGMSISSAIGGLEKLEDGILTVDDETRGPRRVSPFLIPMMMPNGGSGMVGIEIGARGPAQSVTSACASGIDGIGLGWSWIRSGVCDMVVAGGSDATISPIGIASFARMGAMSTNPVGLQPFDANRSGLLMGEACGILILEEYEAAKARGATIYAEIGGYSSTSDAYHITAPHETAEGATLAIKNAISMAGLNAEDVDYISAHGTSTPLNDKMETLAVKNALGDHAYKVAMSSTKSMTGHCMGATGALESVFSVMAMRDNVAPPTINYETPDPDCDLNVVPNEAQEREINAVINSAFGFGGHNAVIALNSV